MILKRYLGDSFSGARTRYTPRSYSDFWTWFRATNLNDEILMMNGRKGLLTWL
jgi:hypothetical protein